MIIMAVKKITGTITNSTKSGVSNLLGNAVKAVSGAATTVAKTASKPAPATTAPQITPAPSVPAGGFNPGATIVRPTVTATDPYNKAAQEAVQGYYDAYLARRQGLIDAAQSQFDTTKTAYDASARRTYGNYLEALRAGRAKASDNGMTGGAIERMNVDSANNYNRGYAANESGRTKTLGNIQTQYNADANSALVDYYNNQTNTIAAGKQAYQQAADQKATDALNRKLQQEQFKAQQKMETEKFNYQKNQDKLNRYAETVAQYNSKKEVNKAIKKLEKSNDKNKAEKLQILRAQAAKFKGKKKSKKKSKKSK